MGLFSTIDALLDKPLAEILAKLPLAEDIKQALLGEKNQVRDAYELVVCFEKGNWIKTPDVEGTVEEIGFRATKVRQFDKALVTLPNSKLANEALINYSRMTYRRIYWKIGIEYRSTHDQIRNIVQDISTYVYECGDFETDPEQVKTFIFLDSFGDSSINIMLYCFTKTVVWGEWLEAKERLAYHIKKVVEGQGASFAFPSSSIYVESWPLGKPETFPLQAPDQLKT